MPSVGGSVYEVPSKNLWQRPALAAAGPHVLVNPVIEEYNGRLYAIGYNRGDIRSRAQPLPSDPAVFYDAATTGDGIWKNEFVDLGDAYKVNMHDSGRILYYKFGNTNPQMIKSVVCGGIRATADGDKFPQMTDVDGFWYGFRNPYPDPNDPFSLENYIVNKGFTMMHDTYVPPFQKEMVKQSKVNTQRRIFH